jgi:hypothetical protein
MKNKLKSIGAVIAGFLTVAVLSTVTDAVLENTGVFPSYENQMTNGSPVWLLLVALAYRSVFAVLGGFVTAKLAPSNAKKLVMILGILGTIGGVVGVIFGWQFGNQWYPVALAITAYPLIWYGGKLAKK